MIINNYQGKKEIAIQLAIPIFYTLIFFKYLVGEENAALQNIFTLGYVLIGCFFSYKYILLLRKNSLPLIIFVATVCSSLFISIFSPNYRFEDVILIFSYVGLGILPLQINLSHRLFNLFAYLILGYFISCIIAGIDPNEIFDVSRNFISVLLLIGLSYHVIACAQNEKKPSLLIFIMSLIIAIWATGRGGIIVFSILLLSYPFIIKTKTYLKLIILFFIVSLVVYGFYNFYDLLFEFGFGRFDDMGLDGDRPLMNAEYISKSFDNIYNFIFGSNLSQIPSIFEVDNNPHNSFIRLHVYYGIIGFFAMIVALSVSVFKLFKNKNYILLLVFLMILFRSFLDSIAFHGPMDPLIYFIVFYSTRNIYIVK